MNRAMAAKKKEKLAASAALPDRHSDANSKQPPAPRSIQSQTFLVVSNF